MLRRVALVRTDVSEELSFSIIRVTRIGEIGFTVRIQMKIFTERMASFLSICCCFQEAGI
jgi:hypothetical protein